MHAVDRHEPVRCVVARRVAGDDRREALTEPFVASPPRLLLQFEHVHILHHHDDILRGRGRDRRRQAARRILHDQGARRAAPNLQARTTMMVRMDPMQSRRVVGREGDDVVVRPAGGHDQRGVVPRQDRRHVRPVEVQIGGVGIGDVVFQTRFGAGLRRQSVAEAHFEGRARRQQNGRTREAAPERPRDVGRAAEAGIHLQPVEVQFDAVVGHGGQGLRRGASSEQARQQESCGAQPCSHPYGRDGWSDGARGDMIVIVWWTDSKFQPG